MASPEFQVWRPRNSGGIPDLQPSRSGKGGDSSQCPLTPKSIYPRFGSWRHPSLAPTALFLLLKAHFATADKLTLRIQTVSAVDAPFRQEQQRKMAESLSTDTSNYRYWVYHCRDSCRRVSCCTVVLTQVHYVARWRSERSPVRTSAGKKKMLNT